MAILLRNSRLWAPASVLLLLGVGMVVQQQYYPRQAQAVQSLFDPIIAGALDIHSHPAPDSQERSLDAVDYARLVKESGMRGFVFKQHDDQTAGLAYIVRKAVPGVEVYGTLVLNRAMGGVNVAAVERFARITGGWGRIVFMPTRDAAQIPVTRDGELLPETKAVIAAVATLRTVDSNGPLVLATGHVSPEESLMILREASRAGVRFMLVTHPMSRWSAEQMQEAAQLGAYMEFTADLAARGVGDEVERRLQLTTNAIRSIGVEHAILSSDLGRADLPQLNPEGLASFAAGLRRHGFTDSELTLMLKENPARLLGLDAASSPAGSAR